jgi:hypothetical protein
MKHQYFGDSRDLFKYDFLLDVLANVRGLERLVLIPMLTPDDESREGERLASLPGRRRPSLAAFLRASRRDNRRQVTSLREYMASNGVNYLPYRDDECFEPAAREEYFASVPVRGLSRSLIFLDPDIGLEPKDSRQMRRAGAEKYLRYDEVAGLARRATSCALIVYQHLQRNKHKIAGDILSKGVTLAQKVGAPTVGYVTDDDVVLYGFGTDQALHDQVLRAFERHGERHILAAGHLAG